MIIDLPRFIDSERLTWTALEQMLDKMENDHAYVMSLEEAQRFHLLYQKVSADLGRVATFASEPELRTRLRAGGLQTARRYTETGFNRAAMEALTQVAGGRQPT